MKIGVSALGLAILWVGCGGSPKAGFEEQTGDPTMPAEAGGGDKPGFAPSGGDGKMTPQKAPIDPTK